MSQVPNYVDPFEKTRRFSVHSQLCLKLALSERTRFCSALQISARKVRQLSQLALCRLYVIEYALAQ